MTLNKLRKSLTEPDSSNKTAFRDYDDDRKSKDMERLHSSLKHFSDAVTSGMIAMKEVASAFEAVGQSFTEMTVGSLPSAGSVGLGPAGGGGQNANANINNSANLGDGEGLDEEGSNSHPADTSANYAVSTASTRLPDETTAQVRRLARLFAEEARKMNEGSPFQTFNAGVHRDVIKRLLPVTEHLKNANLVRRDSAQHLQKYNKLKMEVEQIERRYAKKGKSFVDSKTHKKLVEKRDTAWKTYVDKRDKFNGTFDMLMEINDHTAAQVIHRYLSLNNEYLRQMADSIGKILPAMEEAYPLNSEYSTVQNSMLVEAVATAKEPFGKHHERLDRPEAEVGEGPAEEGDEQQEEGEEEEEETLNSMTSTATSLTRSSESPKAAAAAAAAAAAKNKNNNTNNNNNNKKQTVVPATTSKLEEPAGDDDNRRRKVHHNNNNNANQMKAAADPPRELENETSAADSAHHFDPVHKADGQTGDDYLHVASQPKRLNTEKSQTADEIAHIQPAGGNNNNNNNNNKGDTTKAQPKREPPPPSFSPEPSVSNREAVTIGNDNMVELTPVSDSKRST